MSLFVKDSNVWKESGSGGLSVKDANTWKEVDTGFVKDANVWKEFYKNASYWFSIANDNTSNASQQRVTRIGLDPSATTAVVSFPDENAFTLQVFKVDAAGNSQWGRSIAASNVIYPVGVAVDSSGNSYVGAVTSVGTPGFLLFKFDSSGTIQWQRNYRNTGVTTGEYREENARFGDVKIDSSGNIVCCFYGVAANQQFVSFFIRYDASGNLLAQKFLNIASSTSRATWPSTLSFDSSGNVLCHLYSAAFGSVNGVSLVSLSSTLGSFNLERYYSSTQAGAYQLPVGAVRDSSGNYIAVDSVGLTDNTSIQGIRIVRFDSSGNYRTICYVRGNSTTVNGIRANDVMIDGNDLYIAGFYRPTGNFDSGLLLKYTLGPLPSQNATDSSTLVWAKSLRYGSSTWNRLGDLSITGDSIYFGGFILPTDYDAFFGRVPIDGSLTGTINGITYANDSVLIKSQLTTTSFSPFSVLTFNTPSFSNLTVNLAISNSTFTTTTATFP